MRSRLGVPLAALASLTALTASAGDRFGAAHEADVYDAVFSPDGKTVVTLGLGEVVFHEVATGKVSGKAEIKAVAGVFSPDGKRLYTAGPRMAVIDVASGEVLNRSDELVGRAIVLGPDGKSLVVGTEGKEILELTPFTLDVQRKLAGHEGMVRGLAFLDDGKTLVSASQDHSVRLWSWADGKQVASLTGHTAEASALELGAGGARFATGGRLETILWDAKTRAKVKTLQHEALGVSLSPDGGLVALAGDSIKLIDVEKGEVARTIPYASRFARFSPDGGTLVVAHRKQIVLLDVAGLLKEGWAPPPYEEPHRETITAALFTPDGKRLVTASHDGTAKVWDTSSWRPLRTLSPGSRAVSAAVSGDGTRAASAGLGTVVKVWELETGKEVGSIEIPADTRANSISLDSKGKLLATASDKENLARIWDVKTGRAVGTLEGHKGPVHSVRFSHDGRLIATGSKDATVILWDVKKRKKLKLLAGHEDYVGALDFSRDDATLASGSDDNTVRIWDVKSGQERATATGLSYHIMAVSLSADAKTVATASFDGTSRIFDATTGKALHVIHHPKCSNMVAYLYAAAISPIAPVVVTGGCDFVLRVYGFDGGLQKAVGEPRR